MASTLGTITGKLLVQIANGNPVEIGTIEIPIQVNATPARPTRGAEVGAGYVDPYPSGTTPLADGSGISRPTTD